MPLTGVDAGRQAADTKADRQTGRQDGLECSIVGGSWVIKHHNCHTKSSKLSVS